MSEQLIVNQSQIDAWKLNYQTSLKVCVPYKVLQLSCLALNEYFNTLGVQEDKFTTFNMTRYYLQHLAFIFFYFDMKPFEEPKIGIRHYEDKIYIYRYFECIQKGTLLKGYRLEDILNTNL